MKFQGGVHKQNEGLINSKKQYETTANLKTRISLHEKYSTNKLGFGNWLFNNYQFGEQASILEVGCGTGELWKSHNASIKNIKRLVSPIPPGGC
jgi:hypothetical protein